MCAIRPPCSAPWWSSRASSSFTVGSALPLSSGVSSATSSPSCAPRVRSSSLTADLDRILDLLPSVGHLRIQTADESFIVTRDFPGYSRNEVDDILARAFQDNPGITSIQFPDGGSRAGRTATPDDPFWSRYGRPAAEITAARTRGDITPEEAHRQLISLYSTSTEATQNELTDPEPTGAVLLDQLTVLK